MADDNPKRLRKRSRIAEGQDQELQHLTETSDLSPNQARELLRRHGNDWPKLREAARIFKAES